MVFKRKRQPPAVTINGKNLDAVAFCPETKQQKAKSRPATYREMLRYAEPFDYLLLGTGLLFGILTGIFSPLGAVIFSGITDVLMAGQVGYEKGTLDVDKFTNDILYYSMLYFLQAFNLFTCTLIGMGCFRTLSERIAHRTKSRFLEAVLMQDPAWFDMEHSSSGALIQKMTTNYEKMKNGTGEKLVMMVKVLGQAISALVVGFSLNARFSLIVLSLMPLMIVVIAASNISSTRGAKRVSKANENAGSIADEVISGIRTVMSFNAHRYEMKRYDSALDIVRGIGEKTAFVTAMCVGSYLLIFYVSIALCFWVGTGMIQEGTITPGEVFGCVWSILIACLHFGMCIPQMSTLVSAKVAAGDFFSVIDQKPMLDRKAGVQLSDLQGRMEFKDVYFRYPSRPEVPVLNGVSFTVEPGQTVALVGHSGCGKSTMVGLLMRYYTQESGSVTLDGVPVQDINVEWLRSVVGIVSQEPVLFEATIADNLRLGKPDVSLAEMEAACRMANAHDFILKLPQGYETLIGDGGIKLSGGQKQRLAIARALVREPKILLLDEATSALDTESERVVQAALDAAATGRTTITIAHRLSTVRNAHRIIVFDKGNIVESGTHEELLALEDGMYRQLVAAQEIDMSMDDPSIEPDIISVDSVRDPSLLSLKSLDIEDTGDELNALMAKEGVRHVGLYEFFCYARRYLPWGVPGFVVGCISGLGVFFFAVAYGLYFKAVKDPTNIDSEEAHLYSVYQLLVGVYTGLTVFGSTWMLTVTGEKVAKMLGLDVYHNVLAQDASYFDDPKNSVGKLTSRLATDASNVRNAIDNRLADVLEAVSSFIFGSALAIYFNWQLAIFCLCVSAVFCALQIAINTCIRRRMYADTHSTEHEAKIVSESVTNVRTVQSLSRESHILAHYASIADLPHRRNFVTGWLTALSMALSFCFVSCNFGCSYIIGLVMLRAGYCNPFIIFQVIEALNVATILIMQTAAYFPEYLRARVSISLAFHMLAQKPLIDNFDDSGLRPEIKGNIEVKGAQFSYPNTRHITTLQNVSFKAKFGQTVALVGPSGSGKSTVIQLLERFYDVAGGALRVDGTDVREINVRHLRGSIALVSQEPTLFNLSVRDNIAYGLEDATDAEIEAAAKLANIDGFVRSLPSGYDTSCGGRGTQLSGGQRQRIAIARAIIREPRILLLDEATAALDGESERLVQEALDRARSGRTCIVVAHRLSTIQNADLICVIENGRCVETGTHQQLLQRQGLYASLVAKQV